MIQWQSGFQAASPAFACVVADNGEEIGLSVGIEPGLSTISVYLLDSAVRVIVCRGYLQRRHRPRQNRLLVASGETQYRDQFRLR